MKYKLHTFDLPLRHTFTISYGSRTSQPTLIVELYNDKYSGLGEATATSYYGYHLEDMIASIEQNREKIEQHTFTTPKEFYQKLQEWFPKQAFIRCAFDVAAHDLFAKQQQLPLYKQLGLTIHQTPISTYTIGLDEWTRMKQKLIETPWPLYKIKLGTSDDIQIIKELRKITTSPFIVDANGSWTVEQTLTNAQELTSYNVLLIEQPLSKQAYSEMEVIYNTSPIPCFADESCESIEDIERCKHRFHGVNIKLTKAGGITPALAMLDKAKELGLQRMMGCMTESSVGISAIAHLLPLLDFVDMDGAMLLSQDVASGVKLIDGKAVFTTKNGTGACLLNA